MSKVINPGVLAAIKGMGPLDGPWDLFCKALDDGNIGLALRVAKVRCEIEEPDFPIVSELWCTVVQAIQELVVGKGVVEE